MSNLILLSSEEGQKLLQEAQTPGNAYQPLLHGIFTKQTGRKNCGIQSCALVLSARHLGKMTSVLNSGDELRKKQNLTEAAMFNQWQTLTVTNQERVADNGLTLDEVVNILKAHGATVDKYYGDTITAGEFSDIAKSALSHTNSAVGIIINYHMKTLGQGGFVGHHSPLGAYHTGSGRFLILDTWPETEECWATPDDLLKAMNTVDGASQKPRGFCVIRLNDL